MPDNLVEFYENRKTMKALRGPLSRRATSAEFNEWCAREVAEYIDQLRARLTEVERERDKYLHDLEALVHRLGEEARARGEAEGKLAASEMAGVVEGWIERAVKAETRADRAEEALVAILKDIHDPQQELPLPARIKEIVRATLDP